MGVIGSARRLVTGVATFDRSSLRQPLGRSDRLQPVLLLGSIAAGLGIARLLPSSGDVLAPLVEAGVFVLICLVILGLDPTRIAGVLTERRFLRLAVGLNFVVNPALAWLLGQVFLGGHPDLRVGLVLFLVTPCIGWYLVFTELAGGDTALGVSLLGINLLLQVALLPVYLFLFEGQTASVELAGIVRSILVFLVVPVVVVVVTRWCLAWSGGDIEAVTGMIGRWHVKTLALVVVIVSMFASQADVIFDNRGVFVTLLPPMVAFFVVAFALALAVSRGARLPYAQTVLLVFTTTSRNSEASLAIAATAFASPLVALTVVLGPVIELPLLVLMVRILLAREAGVSKFSDSQSRENERL